MIRLTEIAKQRVATALRPGEIAIDATAGNGHDTVFLAQCVGPSGRVFAFDMQTAAMELTRDRLAKLEIENVDLFQMSHAHLDVTLPGTVRGSVGAVMFNLGYLPGGDHALVTESPSTLSGIDAALRLLRPGGMLAIVAYPGHAGGDVEAAAVSSRLEQLDPTAFCCERIDGQSGRNVSPILFVVTKLADVVTKRADESE
ncbi:methyltransferase domain-containing protein [bacterium]|nr:methyltransferase domain-containing protein [bacterium]